jgi:hypothetical protein
LDSPQQDMGIQCFIAVATVPATLTSVAAVKKNGIRWFPHSRPRDAAQARWRCWHTWRMWITAAVSPSGKSGLPRGGTGHVSGGCATCATCVGAAGSGSTTGTRARCCPGAVERRHVKPYQVGVVLHITTMIEAGGKGCR